MGNQSDKTYAPVSMIEIKAEVADIELTAPRR